MQSPSHGGGRNPCCATVCANHWQAPEVSLVLRQRFRRPLWHHRTPGHPDRAQITRRDRMRPIHRPAAMAVALVSMTALGLSACSTTKTSGPGSAQGGGTTSGPIKIGLVTKTEPTRSSSSCARSAKAQAEQGRRTDRARRQVRRRQRGPGRRDREPRPAGRQGHPHHAEHLRRRARRDQEGPGRRRRRHRAGHRRPTGRRGRRHVRHRQQQAGELQGQWVKATLGTTAPKVVMLDGTPAARSTPPPRRLPHGHGADRTTARRSSAGRTPTATRPRRRPRWRTCCSALRTSTSLYTINEPAAARRVPGLKRPA